VDSEQRSVTALSIWFAPNFQFPAPLEV